MTKKIKPIWLGLNVEKKIGEKLNEVKTMVKKKKRGRPKGTKKINKDKLIADQEREIMNLVEEHRDRDEVEERAKHAIARMQDFQDKALGYLFTLSTILVVFLFLMAT